MKKNEDKEDHEEKIKKTAEIEDAIKGALDQLAAHGDSQKDDADQKNGPAMDPKDARIRELTDMLQRVQAEFINYKNRTEKEKKQIEEYANGDFAKKILPVLDTFEIALKNSQDAEKFRKGMEMTHAQLLDALVAAGLRPIPATGLKFDPYKHEVLMKGNSDKEEDTIIEEFQKGYMFKDKVLRHTKVKISSGEK